MSDDSRKVTLQTELNAEGFEEGAERVVGKSREMAAAVGASADRVGASVAGMGEGAKGAGEEFSRAERSIVASLQRTTSRLETAGQGARAYQESLIRARGLDPARFEPYLAALDRADQAQRKASGSLGQMGVSAGQTNAALRQLPAQFTDIFTSLSSGQAPLTVLIQQGGQIKDSFGGVGAALSGIASVVNPTVLALGALAGGAVAAGAAFVKGQAESQGYVAALALSGNAAGATAEQLQVMAQRVGAAVGTQAKAAEVITQLAASGRVAAADIGRLAEAAIRLERVGGPAAEKTADAFLKLADSPLAASVKLNESARFLTVAVIEQIRALEDQGRATEAARVAQDAYATATLSRANELEQRLGALQTAWRSVQEAAKGAWDAALNIGRDQTLQQQLTSLESRLATAQRLAQGGTGLLALVGDSLASDARGERSALNRSALNQTERAASQREAALLVEEYEKARKANERWADATISNTQKVDKALTEYRRNLEKINEGRASAGLPAIGEKQVAAEEAAIRRQLGGVKALADEERKRAALLNELSGVNGDYIEQLQRLEALRRSGALNEERYTQAVTALIQKQPYAVELARQQTQAERARAKVLDEMDKAQQRYLQGLDRSIEGARRQVEQLEDEFIELTQGKAAREAVVQQRLDDAAAMARQMANGAQWLDGLTDETQKLIALADAQQAVADGRRRNTEQARLNDVNSTLRKQVEEAQKASDEWVADLRSGLTNTLRQAFLQGGDFGKNFARGLAAEVKARLATAIAEALAGQALGALGLAAVGATGSGGRGSGSGQLLQGASALQSGYSLYSGGGIYGQLGRAAINTSWGSSLWYGSGAGLAQGGGAAASLGGSSAGAVLADGSAVAGSSTGTVGAGASWGSWLGWAALIYAASVKANQDWNEGFRRDQAKDVSRNLGVFGYAFGGYESDRANLLSKLGFSDKLADLLTGATAVSKIFGYSAPKIRNEGLTGTITGGDFTGTLTAESVQKAGVVKKLFGGGDKVTQLTAALPDDLAKFLDDGAAEVFRQAQEFGKALGLPAEKLAGVTATLKIQLAKPENDSAEAIAEANRKNMEAIAKAFGSYGDQLVAVWGESVQPLRRYGEDVADTIARVGSAILSVNDVLRSIGIAAFEASVKGGQAAVALQDLFGGQGGLEKAAGGFLQAFYSQEEQKALLRKGLGGALEAVDLVLPSTREEFRKLVEAQDLTTESGRKAFATLLSVSDAFAAITESADGAAEAIRSQREALQDELDALLGNTAAIAERERAKVDPSNLDIYDQLQAEKARIKDEQGRKEADQAAAELARQQAQAKADLAREQQQAAEDANRAWQEAAAAAQAAADDARRMWADAAKSLREEVDRLRGVTRSPAQSLFGAEREFALLTAQARAGSLDAATRLPAVSAAYEKAAEEAAGGANELRIIRNRVAASLSQTEALISGRSTIAATRQGFGYTPADPTTPPRIIQSDQALRASAPAGDQSAEARALREELKQLRAFVEAALPAIARHTGAAAAILQESAGGKRPLSTVAG